MVDIDELSAPEWSQILQSLHIDKPTVNIDTANVVGKVLDSLQKWETFYISYSKWIGFSVRIDDVKKKDGSITIKRYGALNSEANTMIYYASKVEALYKTAKDEIARLTALFKSAFETNSASNKNSIRTPCNYRINLNIIRDLIIVKTKGSVHQESIRDGMRIDALVGTMKRLRIYQICYDIGHDARNCMEKDRIRSSHRGPLSSEPISQQGITPRVDNMLDSSQYSINA
ncbi:hypothetical protein PanWU01x14_213390 [Parasponia andersonii]|uniref:Uncharacterized protein n=1 Tax=Parasponia andersonii TaxID=3476 RepID=A0A2P5BT00_PARAD|nr:hypothetical protein PanWU01x14_213390 [Parasponia andersonii]